MKNTIFFLFLFNLLAICFYPYQLVGQNQCGIYVFDRENNTALHNAIVITKIGKCSANLNAFFKIDCEYTDSVYFECSGYEPIWIIYNLQKDTVFMQKNSILLEKIEVSAKTNSKIYILGKKNRKVDSGYGFRYKTGLKLISIYRNPQKKTTKLIEGYIFLSEKKDSAPNIKVSFYNVSEGKLGAVICENIRVENSRKNRGWYKLDFSQNDRIVIPKEGFIIVVEQLEYSDNLCTIGLLEYDQTNAVDTFLIQPSGLWEKFTILNKTNKHYGIKLYLKVK